MTRFTTTVPTTLLSALSEYLIVFLSSSSSSLNLKIDRLPLAFVARNSKDSGSKKNEGKELGMVAPQDKSSKKMKFASSSAETEPTSQTTISDDSKTGRGMSTMPRVVKRKLQKLRPIVEYNKRGKGIGQAHSEMQSYIGVWHAPEFHLWTRNGPNPQGYKGADLGSS
ncbi:non-ATPase subunit 9 [Prunus dulcis]|uniref:Non-ATPase subunit 9 n=1 Tax=Prunus dulcis TaxID=3755 RepID=A0A5H2Y477_PRUDU|nr:non-ATPase subunit 9 [Prunus dulcis]